ncbi:hypothetical protein NFI96_004201 [Prochilodus magdalenae]|nr:hypothetical protein NFI96_004201 [Prochilodus magdalenae]
MGWVPEALQEDGHIKDSDKYLLGLYPTQHFVSRIGFARPGRRFNYSLSLSKVQGVNHGGGHPFFQVSVSLNTDKTKEMIVDMRKERRPHQPLFIRDLEVERVSSFKYLGVHISDDLTWTLNTTYVLKRAQQRLYFLRRLRKFGMSPRILSNFYSCIIESILTSCITVWYGSTTVKDRKRLQRVVKTATKITKMAQPSLQSIYNLRVHRRAASIIKDPTHPQHGLFTLLPSGRRTLKPFRRLTS